MNIQRLRTPGRWAPWAAAVISSAVFAGPAFGQAHPPELAITFNTAEVAAIEMGVGTGDPLEVTRNGQTLATGEFDGDNVEGMTVNSAHAVAGGAPTGCWAGFLPQILPGDVITVAGGDYTVPNITAESPVIQGDTIVVHGTVGSAAEFAAMDVEIHPANAGRFSGGVGSSGGQFLSAGAPKGFTASVSMDSGSSTNWTARFSGLGDQISLAQGAAAVAVSDSSGGVDPVNGDPIVLLGYESAGVPAAAGGCAGAYAPNEAKSVSSQVINSRSGDLTVTGVSQPGASATSVTLIDSAGRTISAPASGAGTWTATVPAAQLASLSDGAIQVGSTYSLGKGATVKGLLSKDATAPAAPSASVAAGTYTSTQSVSLKAAEGTIRYTTDGSDPSAASAAYSKAISVSSSQTIKAVAIDAAGNVSDVASFGYSIVAPAVAPVVPVLAPAAPKLKLDALTLNSRFRLSTVRKRGMSMVVFAPEGAKYVRVRLLRGNKLITRVVRKVSADGVITVVLPTSKKGRRSLKRGTYRVQVAPGQSKTQFGATTTRIVRIR